MNIAHRCMLAILLSTAPLDAAKPPAARKPADRTLVEERNIEFQIRRLGWTIHSSTVGATIFMLASKVINYPDTTGGDGSPRKTPFKVRVTTNVFTDECNAGHPGRLHCLQNLLQDINHDLL